MTMTQRMHLVGPVSERDHSQGAATAAVTLVQYGDYECPYTRRSRRIFRAAYAAVCVERRRSLSTASSIQDPGSRKHCWLHSKKRARPSSITPSWRAHSGILIGLLVP